MGIATDIVVQHRAREQGRKGGRAGGGMYCAPWQEEHSEEALESARAAIRARLWHEVPKSRIRDRKSKKDALHRLTASVTSHDLASTGGSIQPTQGLLNGNGAPSCFPVYHGNQIAPVQTEEYTRRAGGVPREVRIEPQLLRRNVPPFNSPSWRVVHGVLCMRVRPPESEDGTGPVPGSRAARGGPPPPTPGPVRAKRGVALAGQSRRTLDIAFTGDGRKLLACDSDGVAWLTPMSSGRPGKPLKHHCRGRAQSCAITADGALAAVGFSTGEVALWDCRRRVPANLIGSSGLGAAHTAKRVKGAMYGVSAVELSRDGSFLASAGEDGRLVVTRLRSPGAIIPADDPPELVPSEWLTLEPDDALAELPTNRGTLSSELLPGLHAASLHHIVFSPDGKLLVAVGSRGRVVVINLDSKQVVHFSVETDSTAEHTLLFAALDEIPRDGSSARLAVASTQGVVFVYHLHELFLKRAKPYRNFYLPGGGVTCAAFMPCAQGQNHTNRLVAGSEDGVVMIFDLKAGHQMTAIKAAAFGTGTVHTVQYSSNGRYLLVAGLGPKVLVLDVVTNALLYTLEPPDTGHGAAAVPGHMTACFSPQSNHVAVALDHVSDGGLLVWDITPGAGSVLLQREDDEEEMNYKPHASFTGNELDVLCSTSGGHLQIWDSTTSQLAYNVRLERLQGHGLPKVWEYCAASRRVMAVTDDDTVMLWDLEQMDDAPNPTFPQLEPICEFTWPCSRVHVSPCGDLLVRYGRQQAELFSVSSGESLGQLSTTNSKDFHCFTFSEDGRLLLGSSITCPRLEVWGLPSSRGAGGSAISHLCSLEPLDSDNYTLLPEACCFLECSVLSAPRGVDPSSGWWVAAVASPTSTDPDAAGGVYWWALVSPAPRQVKSTAMAYHPGHRPHTCVFSPAQRQLCTYGQDGMVVLWELKGRGKNKLVLGGKVLYPGGVESISWSSDGSMVATCGDPWADAAREHAHVWNAANGHVVAKLAARPNCHISSLAFSEGNHAIAAAYSDGKVMVYTRAGAADVMPTGWDFWYTQDHEEGGSYHTMPLLEVLERFPLVANHVDHNGHNLLSALVHLRDSTTLEGVLNLMPSQMPVYSLFSGSWHNGALRIRNSLDEALSNQDQGILYDLLMAVADGKVTPQSWEMLMGSDEGGEERSCWQRLCDMQPNLVLVFLTRLQPEVIGEAVDCVDVTGRLLRDGSKQAVVGSSVYLPQDVEAFWNTKLARMAPPMIKQFARFCHRMLMETLLRRKLEPPSVVPHKCTASRVRIPWVLRPREKGLLQPLVESQCDPAVFGTPLVRAVLQYKWEAFGRTGFLRDSLLHLVQLTTFTSFALLMREEDRYPCPYHPDYMGAPPEFGTRIKSNSVVMIGFALQCISAVVAMMNMYRESRQIWANGPYVYFTEDPWNPLDFASYMLIFCILPLNVVGQPTCPAESPESVLNATFAVPGLNEMMATEVVFLWIECLHYAVGFRSTGGMVRIFQQIIIDIRWFMALQLVLMAGFGAAFAVIFSSQLECDADEPNCLYNEAYSTIVYSFTSMIGLLLGDISVLDFFNSPLPFWSVLFMVIYEFLVFVVLFNMLIALMADTFVTVKESEEVQFMRGRAGIICSMEEVMSSKYAKKCKLYPRYLHILQMAEDAEFQSALSSIQGQGNEMRLQLFKLDDSITEKHKEMQREFRREVKAIKGELTAMQSRKKTKNTPADVTRRASNHHTDAPAAAPGQP